MKELQPPLPPVFVSGTDSYYSLQASDFEVLPQAFQAKGFYNITRAANVDCEKVIGYATYTFKGAGSIRFTPSATVIVLGVVGAIALL